MIQDEVLREKVNIPKLGVRLAAKDLAAAQKQARFVQDERPGAENPLTRKLTDSISTLGFEPWSDLPKSSSQALCWAC